MDIEQLSEDIEALPQASRRGILGIVKAKTDSDMEKLLNRFESKFEMQTNRFESKFEMQTNRFESKFESLGNQIEMQANKFESLERNLEHRLSTEIQGVGSQLRTMYWVIGVAAGFLGTALTIFGLR